MLAHLIRTCLCGTCTCGKCKCEYARNPLLDSKKCLVKESTYKNAHDWKVPTDFRRYKALPDASISFITKTDDSIYKTDYHPFAKDHFAISKNFQVEPRNGDNQDGTKHLKAPFPKLSTYKENYPDWENRCKPVIIGRPIEGTTDGRFPFFGKVSNQEYGDFRLEDAERPFDAKEFGKQQFKNPIGPEIEIEHATNHNINFKKPEKDEIHRSRRSLKDQPHQAQPVFKNQFKTSYQNYNVAQPELCPSRKITIELKKKATIL